MRDQYLPVVAQEAAPELLWTEVGQVGGAILCRTQLHGLQPIRDQYSGHMISLDQWETSIYLQPLHNLHVGLEHTVATLVLLSARVGLVVSAHEVMECRQTSEMRLSGSLLPSAVVQKITKTVSETKDQDKGPDHDLHFNFDLWENGKHTCMCVRYQLCHKIVEASRLCLLQTGTNILCSIWW